MNQIARHYIWLLLLMATSANAQIRLSYVDSTAPVAQLTTNFILSSPSDTGGIDGFGERFDLSGGPYLLDTVDFVLDSVGADSTAIDIVPAKRDGQKILPNFSDPTAVRRIYYRQKLLAGQRNKISCGKIPISNSFFVFVFSHGGQNVYRATKAMAAVGAESARAAYTFFSTHGPFPNEGIASNLVDGNLFGADIDVQLDFGVTYIDDAAVRDVTSRKQATASAYPDPVGVGQPLTIVSSKEFRSACVLDDLGRVIKTEAFESGRTPTLQTFGLSPGIYNVILSMQNGPISAVRIVVR